MAIINRLVSPLNGTMQTQRPYVDDIFDPLFNKEVVNYYNNLYGNRLVGTAASYADMWDNALTGREGILGPGMGFLSTFGRSMDKADDFILGGLTEGVNWLGQRLGGNNPDPVNPITNIMVNDYDYQGTRLMAAAGNAMAKLVGTKTPLTEANFSSLGDRIAGTTIDLMTDPGILGGRLATLKAGTPVGDVGHALDTYDNFMANVASNTALPGARHLASKGLNQIRKLVDASSYKDLVDVNLEGSPYYTGDAKPVDGGFADLQMYADMADNYAKNAAINPIDNPIDFDNVKMIKRKPRAASMTKEYQKYLKTEKPRYTYYDFITDNRKMFETRPDNMSMELFDEIQQMLYKHDIMDDRAKIKNYLIHKKGIKNTDQLNLIVDQHLKNYNVKVSRKLKNYLDKHISNAGVGESFKLFNTPHTTYDEFKKSKLQEQTKLPNNVINSTSFTDDIENTFDEIKNLSNQHTIGILEDIKNAMVETSLDKPHLIPKSTKYDLDTFIEDAFKETGRTNTFEDEFGNVTGQLVLGTKETDELLNLFEKELRKRASDTGTIYDYETQTYTPIDDFLNEFTFIQPKNTAVKELKLKNQTDEDYAAYVKKYENNLKTRKNLLKDFIFKNSQGSGYDNPIYTYIKEQDSKTPSTYMLASSTAGLRKVTASKVVDNINLHTAVLISKHPEYFENVDMTNINAFTNTLTDAIKRSFTENTLSDNQLSKMLLSKVTFEDGSLHPNMAQETLTYLRTKYPKDNDIYTKYLHLQSLAIDKRFDEIRTILNQEPRLSAIMFDKVYSPNLKNIFSEFSNTSSKVKNDINTFLNGLSKETKHADGSIEVSGLIPNILRHKDVLMKSSFGRDLLDWAENVQKTIDIVSYKPDPLSGLTPRINTSLFKNTVTGYNKLVNTIPRVNVSLVKGQRLHVNNPTTPQGHLLVTLKDAFDKHTAKSAEPFVVNVPKDLYNKILKGNENNYYFKDFLETLEVGGYAYSKRNEPNLLKPVTKDVTLTFKLNSDGTFTFQDAFNGIEKVNGEYYITSNDTLKYFTKYDKNNAPDFRKVFVNPHAEYVKLMESKNPTQNLTAAVNKTVVTLPPEDFTKTVTTPESVVDTKLNNFKYDIFKSIDENFPTGFEFSKASDADLEQHIKQYGTTEDFTLFKYIKKLEDSRLSIKARQKSVIETHPALRKLRETAKKLKAKYTPEQYAEYAKLTSELDDVVIKGDDMIKYLVGSGGHVQVAGLSEAHADAFLDRINSNIEKINSKNKILESFRVKNANGYTIGYRFVKDANIKKYVSDYYSIFNKRNRDKNVLQDMPLYIGNPKNADIISKKYADLDAFFTETRNVSQDLSTRLGFTNFSENYIKTAMLEDESAQKFFSQLANETKTSLKELHEISKAVGNLNLAERGSFGAVNLNKAYLGSFDNYSQGYSKDIEEVFTSTFTKGMMDNTNAQTFFDLFLSGNNSIRQNFKDLDTLKAALFAKDSKGNLAGNLDNLEVVAPKYNKDGRLVGFKRYNKFSDIELKSAFDVEDAILLPKTILSPLDRMLKKDVRMSNKLYQFINKYVTVPFKFGILSNPGFLVGNMGDAYFKQALTMANKYGTNLEDELVEVAMSASELTALNNKFSEVFDDYCKYLLNEKDLDPIFKKSKSYAKSKLLSPELLINNPEFLKAWTFYLNKGMKSGPSREVAKLYTFLNIRQNTALFKNNNLDLSDVFDKNFQNKYDIPTNRIEKAIYGTPSKDRLSEPGTWGLFMGNPLSDFILKQSNQMESFMRSTAILNDLKHKGYSQDAISKLLEIPTDENIKLRNELKVKMVDATNTMHAANFDYDAVGGIVDEISYIMPFPTFYLKNMEYWITVMTEHPEIIDDIISVHEGMWTAKQEDVENDEFAAEAKGRGAVPILTGKGKWASFVKQTPYNSMFGAFNSLNDPANDFAFRTNPLIKPITRHLQDPEEVRYRPYSTDLYEKNINANDKNFSGLAYMFHQLNPYDKFVGNTLRTIPKIDQGQLRLSDFAPSILQPDF